MCDNKEKEFAYPSCWTDDERMDVLMAPFRIKSVNPENYVSKMNFWQNMIENYCEYKGSPSFNKRELQLAFQRKNKVPYGLDNVLQEMQQTKQTRLTSDYLYDPEDTWTSWAINSFVKKPLWWGVRKIWPLNSTNDETPDFIHLDLVKKFCRDLQNILQKHEGKLMHYEDFKNIVGQEMNINDDGVFICLNTLSCQKKVILEYTSDNKEKKIHLVKIPGKTDRSLEITEADHAVHNLLMTQKDLNKQLEEVESNIKDLDDKVRMYLKKNNRQLAKTYLRKKHLLEKNHERRSIALNNIETMLANVDEAQSNGIVLDAYKSGSKALQKVLDNAGLTYDNVDEVIADVKEAVESHGEIQEAIGSTRFLNQSDDAELEAELKGILEEPAPTPTSPVVNNKSIAVDITDDELQAMLDGLEVEDNDPNVQSPQKPTLQKTGVL